MSPMKRAGVALACGALFLGAARVCPAADLLCPPPHVHCQEKGPRIKFKCICPRPVHTPCESPWFGYYPTSWSPWGAGAGNCSPHLATAPPSNGAGITEPAPMPRPQTAPNGSGQPKPPPDARQELPAPQPRPGEAPRVTPSAYHTIPPPARPRADGIDWRPGAYNPGK